MGYKTWLAAAVVGTAAIGAVAQPGPQGSPQGPGMARPAGEMAFFGPGMLGLDGGPGGPGFGHGWHGHGRHGFGGPGFGGPGAQGPSQERVDARIDRMAERLVQSVYGTPEQTKKIAAIAKQAAADLRELRKQRTDVRGEAGALLKAPTIDRAAIEALRSRQLALADAMSKRATAAFADAAEVLTPEQRATLAERWEKRGARRGDRGAPGERRGP